MVQKILTISAGGILTEVNDAYQGTVTSVAALTLGTTGTDLSSTVATGTSTPVITLQVPTASAANRGALSSTDWSTFNGKYTAGTALTAARPLVVTGSATNWNTASCIDLTDTTGSANSRAWRLSNVGSPDYGYLNLVVAIDNSTSLDTSRTVVATFGKDKSTALAGTLTATTVKVTSSAGYISSDGSTGITTTVTTASPVGKTLTIKDGIITGFA